MDEEAQEALRKIKVGVVVRVKIAQMRNYKFFKKWWSLVTLAFSQWSGTMPAQEYRGRSVLPNIERFRKEVTIMAGYFHVVWNIDGTFEIEAPPWKNDTLCPEV